MKNEEGSVLREELCKLEGTVCFFCYRIMNGELNNLFLPLEEGYLETELFHLSK